jgi:hypothetical protein
MMTNRFERFRCPSRVFRGPSRTLEQAKASRFTPDPGASSVQEIEPRVDTAVLEVEESTQPEAAIVLSTMSDALDVSGKEKTSKKQRLSFYPDRAPAK